MEWFPLPPWQQLYWQNTKNSLPQLVASKKVDSVELDEESEGWGCNVRRGWGVWSKSALPLSLSSRPVVALVTDMETSLTASRPPGSSRSSMAKLKRGSSPGAAANQHYFSAYQPKYHTQKKIKQNNWINTRSDHQCLVFLSSWCMYIVRMHLEWMSGQHFSKDAKPTTILCPWHETYFAWKKWIRIPSGRHPERNTKAGRTTGWKKKHWD